MSNARLRAAETVLRPILNMALAHLNITMLANPAKNPSAAYTQAMM